MSDTIRHSIMDNLLTRLQAISTANGYSADYALIGELRGYSYNDAELPAILLDDPRDTITDGDDVMTERSLEILVVIMAKGDDTNANLRNYIQDVIKCFGADTTCGGYSQNIRPVADDKTLGQAEDRYGDIEMQFNVTYATKTWDTTIQI